jgi:hypothetical protein
MKLKEFLLLAQFHFFELEVFALFANDGLGTAIALAGWFFEVLASFDSAKNTRLLYLAVEASE